MHGENKKSGSLIPFETSRRVWSDPTCMLLVFVGASAEFPLNPSVDWLFYTGRLPADPIGRFLSTIDYLRQLITADDETRNLQASKLKQLHQQLENKRGQRIPATSYRDVLSMDMMYSIRSVPLVTGAVLSPCEKDMMVKDMSSIGEQMGIPIYRGRTLNFVSRGRNVCLYGLGATLRTDCCNLIGVLLDQ